MMFVFNVVNHCFFLNSFKIACFYGLKKMFITLFYSVLGFNYELLD
jgi:hypothetical protein